MKNHKQASAFKLLLTVCCLMIALSSGCVVTPSDNNGDKVLLLPEATPIAEGMNVLLKNDRFELAADSKNMAIQITDNARKVTWRSNAEGIQTPTERNAQFTLSYVDTKGNYSSMNSYTDAVERGQTTVHIIDNSVYIKYLMGNYTLTADILPQRIGASKFQKRIIDKLNDDEAEEMLSYYKYFQTDDIWGIKTKGRNNFMRVYELLQQIGYTEDDIKADNAEFGVTTDSFDRPYFTIVLKLTLNDDGFTVSVPAELIEYADNYMPYQLKVLEYFGPVNRTDEGYLFVPDGSGALINFHKDNKENEKLSLPVYGDDLTVTSTADMAQKINSEAVTLPVFGMIDGQEGFLGIIEDGQASASIEACRGSGFTEANLICPSFTIINKDNMYLEGGGESSKIPQFQKKIYDGAFQTRYLLLNDENNSYCAMADYYRQYLLDSKIITKLTGISQMPFYLETIGGVSGYKNFMGISYIGTIPATSYKENIDILMQMKSLGINNIQLILKGWFNSGIYHQYPRNIKLLSSLGGKNGLQELSDYAKTNNVGLFPEVNLMTVDTKGNGFITAVHASRTLDLRDARVGVISYATGLKRSDNGLTHFQSYILKPSAVLKVTNSFLGAFTKTGIDGLYLRTSGKELYSDFSHNKTVDRNSSMQYSEDSLEAIKKSVSRVIVNQGNSYSIPYATDILNAASESSGYLVTNEDVPFLQMVLHSYVSMSGTSINLEPDPEFSFLKALEYGMSVHYQVTYQESFILKNTNYPENYASYYGDWIDQMKEDNEIISEVLNPVISTEMTDHARLAEGVYRTTYRNGYCVYVNYGPDQIIVDSVTIPAMGYATTTREVFP